MATFAAVAPARPLIRPLGAPALLVLFSVLVLSAGLASPAARLAVGGFLAAAGLAKLGDLGEFARTVRRFPVARIAARSPLAAWRVAAVLCVLEIGLGVWFSLGYQRVLAAASIVALLALFSIGTALALARGERRPCGCLGKASARPLGWSAIARNGLLGLLAVVGAASPALSLDGVAAGTTDGLTLAMILAPLAAILVARARVTKAENVRRVRPVHASNPSGTPFARLLGWLRRSEPERRSAAEVFPMPDGRRDRTEELAPAYGTIDHDEARAVELMIELDRGAGERSPEDERSDDRERELERELVGLDEEINGRLSAFYRRCVAEAGGEKMLARAALLHWTILLRRRAMSGVHTEVEGLVDDPDCAGDLIGDRLLQRYFDALFTSADVRVAEVAAVRALTDLARQSACIGAQQSALLASDLYWSFLELRSFLRANGVEWILPSVAQAASAPLLLFYDVEKWRGLQSPLARWFLEQREALAQGVETKRHPAYWHGLWLYDRRTGHLLGYRAVERASDENDIDLGALFASVVVRENLGRGNCSFAEMVERGAGALGYLCVGSICAGDQPVGPGGSPPAGISVTVHGTVLKVEAGLQKAGLSEELVRTTGCVEGSGVPEGGGGGGGGPCDSSLSVGGRDRISDLVRCVAQQAVQPGEQAMRCIAEATGRCAGPLEKIAKEMQEALFGGVKMGRRCQLSDVVVETSHGPVRVTNVNDAATAAKVLEEMQKQLEAKALEALKESEEAEQRAAEAQGAYENAAADPGMNPDTVQAAKDKADREAEAAAGAKANLENVQEQMEAVDEAAATAKDAAAAEAGRCPPDTPECGGNDCTGMSEAARKTMACVQQGLDPQAPERSPFGGVEPGVVDPSPLDDSQSTSWNSCFDAIMNEAPAPSKLCWAYDCGPENATVLAGGGACGCGGFEAVGEAGGMAGNCGFVDCGEGLPTFADGRCTCGSTPGPSGGLPEGGGPGPAGGGPRFGPFVLGAPQSFMQIRRERDDQLLPVVGVSGFEVEVHGPDAGPFTPGGFPP